MESSSDLVYDVKFPDVFLTTVDSAARNMMLLQFCVMPHCLLHRDVSLKPAAQQLTHWQQVEQPDAAGDIEHAYMLDFVHDCSCVIFYEI